MIPLTTIYDGYIDRPKLTEQKPIWVYSFPPTPKTGRTSSQREYSIFHWAQWTEDKYVLKDEADVQIHQKNNN